MIKNIKHNLKRTGKIVCGRILNTEFFLTQSPTGLKSGRGYSKFRLNNRFLILSTDFPKISIGGLKNDFSMALHIWGKNKSKDNILIKKEFPTIEIAKEFMTFINKFK